MIKLFKERKISYAFGEVENKIRRKINNYGDYQILNEDHDEIAKNISDSHQIKKLEIDFDSRSAKSELVQVSGMKFPGDYDVSPNESYPCVKVTFEFDVDGEISLLSLIPKNGYFPKVVPASVSGNKLIIEKQTFYGKKPLKEELKKEIQNDMSETIELIKKIVPNINDEVSKFNETISELAKSELKQRCDFLQSEMDQDDDLNDF